MVLPGNYLEFLKELVSDAVVQENSHFRTTRRHRSSPAELAETETREQRYLAQVDSLVEEPRFCRYV